MELGFLRVQVLRTEYSHDSVQFTVYSADKLALELLCSGVSSHPTIILRMYLPTTRYGAPIEGLDNGLRNSASTVGARDTLLPR